MKRILWWVVQTAGIFAVACSSNDNENSDTRNGPLSSCALATVIAHLIESRAAADCGHVALDSTTDAALAAHRCAAEAHAASRPFWLTVEREGIDSQISTSYVGTEIDGRFVVLQIQYDSLGMSPNGANVLWNTCTSFAVASECDLPDSDPTAMAARCLSCTADYSTFCECSPSTHRVSCGLQPAE